MKGLLHSRPIGLALTFLLGLVFLVSGITKITALDAFYDTLNQLNILPPLVRGCVLLFLPGIEVALGFCLLFRTRVHDAASLAAALLVGFTLVTAFHYVQDPHGSCGCVHIPWLKRLDDPLFAVIRDCGLLLISVLVCKNSKILNNANRAVI
jgi:uncharacterized membrane protein YphA (DoxX/SURF4 family)